MDCVTLALLAGLLALGALIGWRRRPGKGLPLPGPRGLPVVGYLPFLSGRIYEGLLELAKEYGPVYKVRLGAVEVVCLCDFESIKEAFNNDAFSGRPEDLNFAFSKESLRRQAMTGMPWKEHRKFTLRQLRDLDFGKSAMEENIREEIKDVLSRIEAAAEEGSVDVSELLLSSVYNNITRLLFSRRLRHDEPQAQELDHMMRQFRLTAGDCKWQNFFPWIRAFMELFKFGTGGTVSGAIKTLKRFIQKEVDEHEATLDASNARDFADVYLLEVEKRRGDPQSPFHKDTLLDLARAIFLGSTNPIRNSIDMVLLIAAGKPLVQARVQSEIDKALGPDALPRWQDRLRMPYTEAVICETWRWTSLMAFNPFRQTLSDTTLKGFAVPRNSRVLAVFHGVNMDEGVWGRDPFDFRPERFLSEDGTKVEVPEQLLTFSIGKRSCPGRILARIEVFLYFVAMLQRFRVSLPAGVEADFEDHSGLVQQPERHKLCLERRAYFQGHCSDQA